MKTVSFVEFADFINKTEGVPVSVPALSKSAKRHGIKKQPDGRYSFEELVRARIEGKKMDKSSIDSGGTVVDRYRQKKLEKIDVEIEMLRTKLDELRGNLKPMTYWVSEVREIAAITKASMQHFVAWVSAEIRTPEAYNKAEELAERLCAQLAQKVEDADGNHP